MTTILDAPPAKSRAGPILAITGTLAAHGLLVALASFVGVKAVQHFESSHAVTEMVQVDLPSPPPAPAPTPVTPPSKPASVHRAPSARKNAAPEVPPPPTAAEAGRVLDSMSELADFGDQIVTGSGDDYGGGVTDSTGTSKNAVRNVGPRGEPAVTRAAPATSATDHSRPPQLSGAAQWQCPFPSEADDAGIDHAVVSLRVEVAADGSVRSVTTTSDPGDGFGREARRCALSKRWGAALDRAGLPVAGFALIKVRFDR